MLDAAYQVFAAKGFGRATVEDVCDAAGFTRGAFYSNFDTLHELFFALYEQRSADLVARVSAALARPTRAADPDGQARELVDNVLAALTGPDAAAPDRWFAVNAEFTVYAVRHPDVAAALARHRRALRDALVPALVAATAGRQLPAATATPQLLARTVVAILEGTAGQLAVEPAARGLRAWRRDLLLLAVGVPSGGAPSTRTGAR
jgi:AcrR family transcriptional regulator